MSSEKFDLLVVTEHFQSALDKNEENSDIVLDFYLLAFREILKFFHLMGSIFGFVNSDIKSKIEILEEYRTKQDVGEKFVTVQQMMEYEINTELLHKKDYVSGSRTLLRLHRGLDFIRNLLKRVGELEKNDKTSHAAGISYSETLAKYHPWVIKKAASVAMYALPKRDELLNKVCSDADKAIEILPEMLDITEKVYNTIDALYIKYDLHGLP
ncbi:unnamed protein product [Diamesa hyperborea]